MTVLPSSGEGIEVSYVVTVTPNDQRKVGFLLNTGIDARGGCYILYEVAKNRFNLINDTGSGSKALGTEHSTTENGQCIVRDLTAKAETNNGALNLRFALTFKPSFAGGKKAYVYTEKPGAAGEFQPAGTWMVSNE